MEPFFPLCWAAGAVGRDHVVVVAVALLRYIMRVTVHNAIGMEWMMGIP
jgi:hypothetical protein